MLDWSLLSGPIPVVLRVSAVVAALWLLSRTLRARRQPWVKWVDLTACLLVAAVVTAVVAHLARIVWMLYPDNLAPAVYLGRCGRLRRELDGDAGGDRAECRAG